MTKEDIKKEAARRYPSVKPKHYLTEGKRLGFIAGALYVLSNQDQ